MMISLLKRVVLGASSKEYIQSGVPAIIATGTFFDSAQKNNNSFRLPNALCNEGAFRNHAVTQKIKVSFAARC